MMHFLTFLILLLALIDYNHGLNCYYCLPCNGTNARIVTCNIDKNFCSLAKGTDPTGEEKTMRRCEASTSAVSGNCYSNGTYEDYTNVQICLCNTDGCNIDYSFVKTNATSTATVTTTVHTATFTTTITTITTLSSNTRSSASYAMNSNKVVFLILFSVVEKLTIL